MNLFYRFNFNDFNNVIIYYEKNILIILCAIGNSNN